ncbi:hypothetical protein C8F01DRAFT_988007 [Mycena amicta]|nr:hypothetical protein C8F01DRAFT_988007 [Mycena amicta]
MLDNLDDSAQRPPASNLDRRASVKEIEDEEDEDLDVPGSSRWSEDYPEPAGCKLDDGAKGKTAFEAFREQQIELGLEPWAPFDSEADWELARWLVESGVSRTKMDEFLKLAKIKHGAKPSYHNAYSFYQKIDALPSGPQWECEIITITGDKKGENGKVETEEVEFWKRDPIECIEELIGNPAFEKEMSYVPHRVYRDANHVNREYSEVHTGDLWWELQGKIPVGHTVCPVILATDETQLSNFSGDKKAWPVYLSIGNLSMDVRRKPSLRGTVLIGYMPVSKFHCFSKAKRAGARYQLFHKCMGTLLERLKVAGKEGLKMLCADKCFRQNHPILAAYLADHPERCLVTCCSENFCTGCDVHPDKRGEPIYSAPRDPKQTIKILRQQAQGLDPPQFDKLGLRLVNPFWKDLPHCNIFQCFQPDKLHQLDVGVFHTHTVSWATDSLGGSDSANNAEIDRHFQALPNHPSLRHFRLGISLVSQWTGNECKAMEKVFLGVLNGTGDARVLLCVRAVLDFIYFAHFETHTDASLAKMTAAFNMFHDNKKVFFEMNIRPHFNIPKVHSMMHYVALIRAGGSTGNYTTEISERLHIDCAKLGYRASNRKNYIRQMTRWLTRRESLHRFAAYLQWALPGYKARLEEADSFEEEEDIDDDDGGKSAAPVVDDTGDTPESTTKPAPFKIAKSAPFSVSVKNLQEKFGAADFLHHLEDFLQTHSVVPADFSTISCHFPVYKRVTIAIPPVVQVFKLHILDPIRATCAIPSKNLTKSVPAHFDTVLARKEKPVGIPKRLSLDGLYAGRVRAIFALPIEYGRFDTPLAYIEWFKPLTQRDEILGMFKIAASTHNNRRRASIIPVTLINRSCHLIPQFSRQIDRSLTTDNVLDIVKLFYLNPYLRHIDFVLLRDVE